MNTGISRRILSLFLALALTVGLCPVGAAADDGETRETLAVETTVPETQAETTEAATQPSETAAPTVPETTAAEETEATQAAEPEVETTAATEPTVETIPEMELPYGFAGLPQNTPLSAQALADKQAMTEHQAAENTAALIPGEDYEEGVVLVSAESQEEAQRYADAFSAQLVYFYHGLAKLRLTTATVAQAVEAAQDMALPLPAAYPNHRTTVEPEPVEEAPANAGISLFSDDVPQRQSWQTWKENLDNPDLFLKDPTDYCYQYAHDVVDSYAAWGVTTGKGVTVAVLDTGVNAEHEDLKGKVTVSPLKYYDKGGNLQQLPTNDYHGHGTHVAGIIAAAMNNGFGGAGIAPDAHILSIRVADSTGKMDDYIITAIYQAAEEGANVINMSLGSPRYNQWLQKAVNDVTAKGITVVAAMGNDGSNCMEYPACCDNVIGVVATNRTNTRAAYSSYGPRADVAAPGSEIYSTVPGGYRSMDGTSMAAPVVAGVVALYKSVYPDATPAQIEARLKSTATRGGSDLGAGIVNAAAMLSAKPAAPAFVVTSGGEAVASSDKFTLTVPRESQLSFSVQDEDAYILYTLDSSTPSVMNGSVVRGIHYTGPVDLSPYAGKTITVKAVQVNGLGMAGRILSRRIQVKPGQVVVDRVEITGPSKLIAGKTGEFRAKIIPAQDWMVPDQSVTWQIAGYFGNLAGAKINSGSGTLTTPSLHAGTSGWVDIAAVSKTYAGASATFRVSIEAMDPVKTMTLSQARLSAFTGNSYPLTVKMYSAAGVQVMPDVRWTSSNPKVAAVDETGEVTALSRGSAIITCKALDGSGKSAKCSVSVQQAVENMTITGQTSVAPGASATFRATVYPSNATKSFTWSVKGAPEGTTISSSGRLRLSANAREGDTFTVCAQPPAGAGKGAEYQVLVKPKASVVKVLPLADSEYTPLTCSFKGSTENTRTLTGVTLYSVDPATEMENRPGRQDQVELWADTFDKNWNRLDNQSCIRFSSSNSAVASVSDSGLVTAHKAGTAKITVSALDGSGKKATVAVTVLNPVSTFCLNSSAPKGNRDWALLATGKSVTHKPVFATTYGKPSNQKVTWNYEVLELQTNGAIIDHTPYLWQYIKLDKNGRLTISSSAEAKNYVRRCEEQGRILNLCVTATSQDYTQAQASFCYQLVCPATIMKAEQTRVTNISNGVSSVRFYCDQWSTDGKSDFVITSSNPAVASVYKPTDDKNVYSANRDGWYTLKFYSSKPGTARLTIRTTDGTNKSCTISVTVK